MLRSLTVLSLATAVLAVPTPGANPGSSIVDAFRAIRRNNLEKRQSLTGLGLSGDDEEVLTGLQDLLQKSLTSVASGGECSSECESYAGLITDCASGSSYTSIGLCACRSSTLSAMETCGSCFGSDSREDATDFAGYCSDNGAVSSSTSRASGSASASATGAPTDYGYSTINDPTGGGGVLGPGATATRSTGASATNGGGSVASGTAASSAGGFGGLNDIGASASSVAAEASGSVQDTINGGGNGAGALTIGATLIAGAVGGAAALLAL
ncbi:hypothetical protein JCM6882_002416 [Rhodosporidiobolus microsporus]